jgi:hypothetical protein
VAILARDGDSSSRKGAKGAKKDRSKGFLGELCDRSTELTTKSWRETRTRPHAKAPRAQRKTEAKVFLAILAIVRLSSRRSLSERSGLVLT